MEWEGGAEREKGGEKFDECSRQRDGKKKSVHKREIEGRVRSSATIGINEEASRREILILKDTTAKVEK